MGVVFVWCFKGSAKVMLLFEVCELEERVHFLGWFWYMKQTADSCVADKICKHHVSYDVRHSKYFGDHPIPVRRVGVGAY